jgi:phosphatidate cytidylyltransferase
MEGLKKEGRNGLMNKRVTSGALGGAFWLSLILIGGLPYALSIVVLVIWGIKEYTDLLKHQGLRPQTQVVLLISLLLLTVIFIVTNYPALIDGNPLHHSERFLTLMLTVTFFVVFANELLSGAPEQGLINAAVNLFGTVYIGFLFAYMLLLRYLPAGEGLFYVLFTVLVTWLNDTSAYFIGIRFGRHKLSPRISPKKSVEGSAAGLIGGVITAIVMGMIFQKPLLLMVLMGVVVVVGGQCGDLIESIIKRNAGVKDSGAFLPGHGGVLDRFDSLLTAAPLVYYLATYVAPFIG